ncbi:MAG: response regulator [Spirochaetaceae bacterium]|nr:response regulator [Spirochaetaceae bacterium]MCF7948916.1 response regulator [Spirochaetia bacterium]MCF7951075.1 response regulator [Spirochaetaceae bacterium]
METKPLILIVEDDPPIKNFLRTSLKNHGYRLLLVEKGGEAISMTASHMPDLILLDLGLPDIDGIEVIRQLRSWSRIPVVVVSAREQERSKIEALDSGADDYLTKPFSIGELLARIRVALRHSQIGASENPLQNTEFRVGDLVVDMEHRRVKTNGKAVHLTPTEYKIVALLAKHAGKVLTHRFILKEIWGPSSVGESQYLRVFMANLRRKIEPDPTQPRYLITEIGVGYRLLDE